MRVRAYVEEGLTEGALPVAAWAIDFPGAYAEGANREQATQALADEVRDYWRWLRKHGEAAPPDDEPVEVHVEEAFSAFKSTPNYEVWALPSADVEPVRAEETTRFLRLLAISRAEVLDVLEQVPPEAMDWKRDERTRTIREILRHIAQVELWYSARLFSEDPIQGLREIRAVVVEHLAHLDEDFRRRVVTHVGERWSARKVFRRLLYHERYHRKSIWRILADYRQSGTR